MILETLSTDFRKARSVNATDTSFPSKIPTITEPAGDAGTATGASVIELASPNLGRVTQNAVLICPYAIGDDNDVFDMRVIGWRRIFSPFQGTVTTRSVWIPVQLAGFTCTIGTSVGIAGAVVLNTERFADTIALTGTAGNDDVNLSIVSPADNTIGYVVVDLAGFQKLELTFDSTTGDPTSMNALVALL